MVRRAWPADPVSGTWPANSTCAGGTNLPAVNSHFAQGVPLLVNENADPDGQGPLLPPPEDNWLSRNMADEEWWVIIDICYDPVPGGADIGFGTFVSYVLALPQLRQRVAWASVNRRAECQWC